MSGFSRSFSAVVVHDDAAVFHHVGVRRHVQGELGVLFHEQDGDLLLCVESRDDVEDLVDQQRRQPHGRLIQQDQLGAGHQRPAHHGHLLLAAADEAGDLVALLLQPREVVVDHLQPLLDGTAELAHVGAHLEVLLHRQVLEDPAALDHLHDAQLGDLLGRHPVDALAHELDRAVGHLRRLHVSAARRWP